MAVLFVWFSLPGVPIDSQDGRKPRQASAYLPVPLQKPGFQPGRILTLSAQSAVPVTSNPRTESDAVPRPRALSLAVRVSP